MKKSLKKLLAVKPILNERKYDKYCSECSPGLFSDAKFCPNCGAKLK